MLMQNAWLLGSIRAIVQRSHSLFAGNGRRQGRLPNGCAVTDAEIERAIAASWCRETSDDPQRWSLSNPACGQCAVTALVVQDFLGGELIRANINLTPHYWNRLPNRNELDLTKAQFKEIALSGPPAEATRQAVLSFSSTRRNYKLLRKRVLASLRRRSHG